MLPDLMQVKRANFQIFPGGMPPDPLTCTGAYQVHTWYVSYYIAQHLINSHF